MKKTKATFFVIMILLIIGFSSCATMKPAAAPQSSNQPLNVGASGVR